MVPNMFFSIPYIRHDFVWGCLILGGRDGIIRDGIGKWFRRCSVPAIYGKMMELDDCVLGMAAATNQLATG